MDSKRPARRQFLKSGAALAGGFTLGAAVPAIGQAPPPSPPMIKGDKDQIPYGDRSKFVKSVRIAHGGRPSPDAFGLYFHIATPLQDSVGVITPSSLHFVGTTRGAYIPEIDPREHRLLIHGMVDRPLTFTMEDLKRLPSVTRLHFIECAGNRASRNAKTVQESHGMTSCAEWTGVPLSVLLKECGLKGGASWFVAEGSEEVKGASSMPIAKAMDDCLLAYGMNGEDLRPQQGFPLRLMVPGFEGIFHTKYLRRIKIVDRYYMNYNDYGHLDRDPEGRGAGISDRPQIGHHVPFRRTPAAGQGILRDQRPGLVRWRSHSQGGSVDRRRQALEHCRDQGDGAAHGACAIHASVELGRTGDRASFALHGRDRPGSTVASSGRRALEGGADTHIQRAGAGQHHSAVEDRQRWERPQWECLEFSCSCRSWASARWRSRLRMEWDARRARRKSARGISPSVLPERNSRRGAERRRRAPRCIARSARAATGRRGSRAERPL